MDTVHKLSEDVFHKLKVDALQKSNNMTLVTQNQFLVYSLKYFHWLKIGKSLEWTCTGMICSD